MTLQQMRYLIAIAEHGSLSAAAKQLFVAQSSLSEALREVERETGVTVFTRTNHGVEPTLEGLELIGMVRQVVLMDDMLASRYGLGAGKSEVERLAVSTQRYSFATEAVAALMGARPAGEDGGAYSFVLRETDTGEVIDDVRSQRSELGILCLTAHNGSVIRRAIETAGLEFSPLVSVPPRVLVGEQHPLAAKDRLRLAELAAYPRVVFEQGGGAAAYYSEDPLPEAPRRGTVAVRDRSSVMALLNLTDAYAIATGLKSKGMDHGVVTLPLDTAETMEIGCVTNPRRVPSATAREYLEALRAAARAAR